MEIKTLRLMVVSSIVKNEQAKKLLKRFTVNYSVYENSAKNLCRLLLTLASHK